MNALKTVSMRIRGVKSELEQAGEDTEGMVTNTAKLQEKIMALTNIDGSGGVDILTRSGDFKSTYDILLEISKVWKDMGDVEQAALLELVAGKTRGSVVAALFQNGDVLEKAYKSATDASGSAMRELENHLDSIQGRIDLFNNALQTMWMNLLNSEMIKGVVDIGTMLVKAFDTIPGKLATIGLAISGMYAHFKLKKNEKGLLDLIFDVAPKKIKNSSFVKNFVSTIKTSVGEALKNTGTESAQNIFAEFGNHDYGTDLIADAMAQWAVNDANMASIPIMKKQVEVFLQKKVAQGAINQETAEAILANIAFATSEGVVTSSTLTLSKSLSLLWARIAGLARGIWALIVQHPYITALVVAVAAVGAALTMSGKAHEKHIEQLNEETEALKSVQSELESVRSELEATSSRMDELKSKGKLSFVEEEEYNRLQQITEELKRQEAILLAQEKRAKNKQVQAALNALKSDPNLRGYTDVATSYAASQSQSASTTTTGISYAAGLQNTGIPSTYTSDKNKYEINLQNLQEAKKELEEYETQLLGIDDAESKEYKNLETKVTNAKKRIEECNKAIDSMSETWQKEYGDVGYVENPTEEYQKQWNEFYRQHQNYLMQQGFINGTFDKGDVLDSTFGMYGTDSAQQFKKEFESAVKGGKDPTDVIEEMLANEDYSSAFSGLEEQFGITMDNIKAYFTQTGEFKIDPEFSIAKYSKDISSHSAVISEFQEAIQKLGKGSFTMDDYLDLIERFPDLAKGVDISSNAFYGLSRNLNKAIKTRTKDFVDDLKSLKDSMLAAGKSTDSIDQLIAAIENMPEDALDNTIQKYSTLAEKIERAKVAQDKLLASMEENPNDGYENRGEAMEYMKEAMKNGEIGSESNLWNVAKQYGFTSDEADLNKRADALAKFIAIREKWFAQADDGDDRTKDGYSYKGTENFIEAVESASQSVEFYEELKKQLGKDTLDGSEFKWLYDENTGTLDFDFDNENWDAIVAALSETEELAGLTSDEFADLMIQVGQYFNVKWGDANDVNQHITKIAEGSGTAADKIDQMTDSVETYVEKALGTDIDLSSLTEAGIEALSCDKNIKDLLRSYLALKDAVSKNPFSIKPDGDIETDIINPLKKAGLKVDETIDAFGQKQFTFDVVEFESLMRNNGYTTENIMAVVNRLFGEGSSQSELVQTREYILGLSSISQDTAQKLREIGIASASLSASSQGAKVYVDSSQVDEALQKYKFTDEEITKIKAQWSASGIDIITREDTSGIDNTEKELEEMPKAETVTINVAGTAPDAISTMQSELDTMTAEPYQVEVNIKKTGSLPEIPSYAAASGDGGVNGTAHVKGTAYNSGSWGASETETSLVGELGPELLVRGNRWTTVGENGAEFTQVKKGDIIFNHKQTESLLKNGYVTGRGKAYASGTAYASGGGMFSRYEFSGNGGYVKYDVNDNALDKFGDATSSLSNAANDLSDSTEEFKEVFDWIEVRLEELDETLGLLEAQLENVIHYNEKNNIIDDIIAVNKTKLENLNAGYAEYTDYAAELLTKIPEKYRDAAKNGAIAIERFVGEADETTLEAINNYREWVQKAADLKQQSEEIITAIRDLAIQKFDNVYESGDTRATVEDSQTEKLQNQIDLLEEMGEIASTVYYGINGGNAANSTGMFENSYKKIEYLTEARKAMQAELNEAVEAGQIKKGSNEWYELIDQMYQVDSQIHEATAEIEEFQNAINDIHWENFDQLISRIDYLKDENQNLIDLMDSEDMVIDPEKRKYENGTVEYWTADDVKWSKEGLASLGLYAQQMEIAEHKSKQYADAIDGLTTDYNNGLYSENEYLEKLNELKDGQYEAIESYYDAQDAIKDLNETRIDSIKEGIEKEIDAYEELIEKRKEALDAEKEAYDFQKTVTEQQKDITAVRRKLAALSSDNSMSARAQRAQLEAELAEAEAELQETYYEQSIEDQKNALDANLENFQKEKDAEITKLEEYLEDVEKVVADSLGIVQANATEIGKTLTDKANEYNLTVSDAVLTPWKDGSSAISNYQETFGTAMSSTMDQLEKLKNKWQEVIDKMDAAGNANISDINKENANYAAATYKEPPKTQVDNSSNDKEPTVGCTIDAGSAPIYINSNGDNPSEQYYKAEPYYTVVGKANGYLLVRHKSQDRGYTGWFKSKDVTTIVSQKYAKGTKGVDEDQWALIDELGEELIIRPSNGRMTFLEKGSGVVPADLTSNLMEWGALDPSAMLDQNRPVISAPHITNNETVISIEYGDILHIDNFNGDKPEDLSKMIDKAFNKHMKDLNQQIRRYTR